MGFSGDKVTVTPTFVNYVEGIYVGYKFYETAADEGLINYDDTVMFPFGYGLSYTTFKQEMGKVSYKNGKISFDVTVTNTGDKAGKDVVEVYYNRRTPMAASRRHPRTWLRSKRLRSSSRALPRP